LLYLVAVLEWCSRYGLSWVLSLTLDRGGGLEALEHTLGAAPPERFSSDQEAQLTRSDCTGRLESAGIRSRREGRGRALDTVFVEWLWRTVKYEAGYGQDDDTPREATQE
jgi:putative transposase